MVDVTNKVRVTHRQLQSWRRGVKENTVRDLFIFIQTLEFYGVTKVRREYFLAQLLTDTDGLTKVGRDPKETFQTALDIWNEKRLNTPSDFRNFGEVVRQYVGHHRDIEKRLSWLSRLILFIHLLK